MPLENLAPAYFFIKKSAFQPSEFAKDWFALSEYSKAAGL